MPISNSPSCVPLRKSFSISNFDFLNNSMHMPCKVTRDTILKYTYKKKIKIKKPKMHLDKLF